MDPIAEYLARREQALDWLAAWLREGRVYCVVTNFQAGVVPSWQAKVAIVNESRPVAAMRLARSLYGAKPEPRDRRPLPLP